MNKYRKYHIAQYMFESGKIKKFRDFEKWLPVSRLAKDLHTSPVRVKKLLTTDVSSLTLWEHDKFAEVLKIDYTAIRDLAERQYQVEKEKKRARIAKSAP